MGLLSIPVALVKKAFRNPIKSAVALGTAAIGVNLATQSHDVPDKPSVGPLAGLESENNPFDFKTLQYPLEGLGEQYPHYITFSMLVKNKTKYTQKYEGLTQNREEDLKKNSNQTKSLNNIQLPGIGQYVNFSRQTTRTSQTIRLYMPDTMHWQFGHSWKDVSLSDVLPFAKTTDLAASILNEINSGKKVGESLSSLGNEMATLALEVGGQLGKFGGAIDRDRALRSFGYAVNPNIDVIYGSPGLRDFVFDFMFAPRSTFEANQVLSIIRAFKFHAAPEAAAFSGAGRYWIPPTEFKIEFSAKNLGKVAQCVLTTVDVDYAPNGFTVYSEEIKEKDMPSYIRMQLNFRELEFITKEKVLEGF
jgi:hypothetical protein